MRIDVRRTGGFSGIERRAGVDTTSLPDAEVWEELAARALETATPPRPPASPTASPTS